MEMELQEFQKAFGAQLLKVREANGLTQTELHKNSGLTIAQISDFENGKVNLCLDSIRKLCKGLQKKPIALFDWQ